MTSSSYSIVFARSASKELEALDTTVARRVVPRIKALADNPRPTGCKKLSGVNDTWRIRVGDYRVVYRVEDGGAEVRVMVVRHRSKAYE